MAARIDGTRMSNGGKDEQMTTDLSLQAWFDQATDGEAMDYPCMRCAGLFRSLYAIMGEEAAAPAIQKTAQDMVSRMHDLLVASLYIRGNGDMNNPEVVRQVPASIMKFAEFYAERMAGNVSATGDAFLKDDMIKSDFVL